MDNSQLAHSGILGMKWGVRRYQNKDGTLTPAGKRRLAKLQSSTKYLGGEDAVKKAKEMVIKPEPKPKADSEKTLEELQIEKARLTAIRDIRNLNAELNPRTKSYADSFMKEFGNNMVTASSKLLTNFATEQAGAFLTKQFGIYDPNISLTGNDKKKNKDKQDGKDKQKNEGGK